MAYVKNYKRKNMIYKQQPQHQFAQKIQNTTSINTKKTTTNIILHNNKTSTSVKFKTIFKLYQRYISSEDILLIKDISMTTLHIFLFKSSTAISSEIQTCMAALTSLRYNRGLF